MKKRVLIAISIGMLSLSILSTNNLPNCMTDVKAQNVAYDIGPARWEYGDHGWYYTLDEMEKIYEKEYEEGERLENRIIKEDGKIIGIKNGNHFEIDPKFIDKTLGQLEEMLDQGYAKYIFRLDAFHSHLFLPEEIRAEKYMGKSDIYILEEITKDEQLGALYHNSEHLALRDPPKTGEIDPEAKELISKRSVLGWYDERPLELTYPEEDDPPVIKEANTASIPEGYKSIENLTFKANKNGEFSINHNGKEIRIDISFDANNYY